MIRCQNCGAEYETSLRQCPYCHATNEAIVEREHAQALEQIDRETRNLVHLPGQLVNRFSGKAAKGLALTVAAILVMGLAGVAIRAVQTYVLQQTEPERQEKHFAALDQLVEVRDYEGIWDYLSDHDLYGGTYQEYGDLYFASYALYYVDEFHECIERGGVWESTLGWTVSEVSQGILDIDAYLERTVYVHGVDAVLEEIRADLHRLLTAELGLTEEELQQAFALCKELAGEEDYEKRIARFTPIGVTAADRQGIRILMDDETLE